MTADPSEAQPLVVAEDVRREFGGVVAVDCASLSIRKGEITGLIGPNGAGKSTLLGMIAGVIRPTSGTIIYDGESIVGEPPYRIGRRGMIRTFQFASEFGRLTVLENLLTAAPCQRGDSVWGALLGRRYWRESQQRLVAQAYDLLERFDMSAKANEYAGDLSGGQKRIVEVMRALMAEPRVLLLDEPMAGVNPTLALEIEGHLKELRARGLTMLMVEHEMGTVERLCDSIFVMAQGRTIMSGSMDEIRSDPTVVDAYLVG